MEFVEGSERFQILREVGSGGMGVVYEANDAEKKIRVALKTLTHLTPAALYQFKREFRFLEKVNHRNLATLYELFCRDETWFFTMEFIEGVSFLEHVMPNGAAVPGITAAGTLDLLQRRNWDAAPTMGPNSEWATRLHQRAHRLPSCPCDIARLRPALIQLVEAILALHDLGILHRDLKPLNVKVTPQGRVVVLDFGLAEHFDAARFEAQTQSGISGTIPYMSPEQAAGERLTELSDWYSVGVMLYEALTGRHPFEGNANQVLLAKQRAEAPSPTEVVGGVPEELIRICAGLVRRDPRARWCGKDVIALLERRKQPREYFGQVRLSGTQRIFVGRQEQLTILRSAFSDLETGVTGLVCVHGNSAMGKSTLVRRFLEELSARSEVVILAGRCYEQESVPYKALDSVIDALTNYLERLSHVAQLIPRDAAILAQAFPVLQQLEIIAAAPRRTFEKSDQHELRRRVFLALRELLARLGDRRRLVLYIDDLQWGDTDSGLLLREILRPPDPPVLLLIGSYRDEYAGKGLSLSELITDAAAIETQRYHDVPLGPLATDEIRNLVSQAGSLPDAEQIQALASESGGNPYFIHELLSASENGVFPKGDSGGITLESVIWGRIASLPKAARRLLEVVAVSGRPMLQREAYQAAGLEALDPKLFVGLRSARLINTTGPGEMDEVEAFHDRIREIVLTHLDDLTLRQHHREIAVVLEASDSTDAENVGRHWEAAGKPDPAGRYYQIAAANAAAAFAFKHAAELYREALSLRQITGEEKRQLRLQFADALANAGCGLEAARNYQEVAQGAGETEAFELERRAAYWLSASGHVDEGREAFRKMLQSVGLKLPGSPKKTLLSLLTATFWLRLRGLGFQPRKESEIPRAELDRIDAAWYASQGLTAIDFLNGANFTTRALLLALHSGESHRIARSLGWMLPHTSCQGPAAWPQLPKLAAAFEQLAESLDTPYLRGALPAVRGGAAFFQARWNESLTLLREGKQVFSEQCTGVAREISNCQLFSLYSLFCLGRYGELSHAVPQLLDDARERGDLYLTASIGAWFQPLANLTADRPREALRNLEEALSEWTRRHYHIQHANAAFFRTWIHLYQDDALRLGSRSTRNGRNSRSINTSNWKRCGSSCVTRVPRLHWPWPEKVEK